jgi:hypothetical protein
MGSNMGD